MACNGRNHPASCQCNFRGGHPNSQPRWRGWRPSSARRLLSGPNTKCPECRAPVYFFAGGGTYFDCLGPPWKRHICTDPRLKYSPFNAKGDPKLRNRRSEFERNGWLPFFIRNVEALTMGTIVHGVVLDDPTVLHFGFSEQINPDKAQPTFIRLNAGREPRAELNFFLSNAAEPISVRGYESCRDEMELLLKQLPAA